jgi:nucleotide-binding universal stress UspA family protein
MKKILIATDFSKASEKATDYAFYLFSNTECEFTLMYAYDIVPTSSPEMNFSLTEEMYSRSKKEMQIRLDEIQKNNTKQYHTFKIELMPTSPSSAIQILNRKNNYDFVVVGATGKGDDVLFGSTATDVVRNAPVNALVIPVETKLEPIKNVVLAVDYQAISSFNDFDGLKDILQRRNASLTLLTILKDGEQPSDLDGLMKFEYHDYFEDVKITDYFIHESTAEQGIMEYLSYHKTDLMVMLTRHHSFFDVLFNRSVTRRFAFNPTIPLMSIFCNVDVEVPEYEVVTF